MVTHSRALIPALGSCWALGVLYSGVAGSHVPKDAALHAQDRIAISYLDLDTLDAMITPPTNKVGPSSHYRGTETPVYLLCSIYW